MAQNTETLSKELLHPVNRFPTLDRASSDLVRLDRIVRLLSAESKKQTFTLEKAYVAALADELQQIADQLHLSITILRQSLEVTHGE